MTNPQPITTLPRFELVPGQPALDQPTRVYLIRHGRTDWNDEGRYQGHADPPLNSQGFMQAYAVALKLGSAHVDAIYSSDLQRAQQTARVFADLAGVPLQLDARLREIRQGKWQGLLTREIQAQYPELFARWRSHPSQVCLPDGETLRQLEDRLVAALDDISNAHPGETVAVFTHKIPIAIIRCRAQGRAPDCFWEMIPTNGAAQLLEWSGVSGTRFTPTLTTKCPKVIE